MSMRRQEIEKLVKEIYDLLSEYCRLIDYGEIPQPGPPANENQIRAVEQAFDCTLPSSYRLFLSIHNGWKVWSGDVVLLSTEQMLVGKYAERIMKWRAEAREFNPTLIDSAIVIGFSLFAGEKILVDRSSAEQDIVIWDYAEDERFPDFGDYLQAKKEGLMNLLAGKRRV